jgi:hypothetical protein
MQYATIMGELYALTDHKWEKFLTQVSRGQNAGEVIELLGKHLGRCRAVIDWTNADARAEIDTLPKPRLDRRYRRRFYRLSSM